MRYNISFKLFSLELGLWQAIFTRMIDILVLVQKLFVFTQVKFCIVDRDARLLKLLQLFCWSLFFPWHSTWLLLGRTHCWLCLSDSSYLCNCSILLVRRATNSCSRSSIVLRRWAKTHRWNNHFIPVIDALFLIMKRAELRFLITFDCAFLNWNMMFFPRRLRPLRWIYI